MQYLDIYILIILILSIAKGYHYRFMLEFAGFVGILAGVMVASNGNDYFGDFLNAVSVIENHKNESTFVISFMMSVFGIWFITLLMAKVANKTIDHHLTDHILGGFASLIKSMVIISYILAVSCKITYIKVNYQKDINKFAINRVLLSFGQKILLNGNRRIEARIKRIIKFTLTSTDKNYYDNNTSKDTNRSLKIKTLSDINGQETLDVMGKNIEERYIQSKKYSDKPKDINKKVYTKKIQQEEKTKIKKSAIIQKKETHNSNIKEVEYLDDKFLDEMYQETLDDVKSLDEDY